MSVKVMGLVWDMQLPPGLKLVLLAYADHANHEGGSIFPSVQSVAEKTGYTERNVQLATRKLQGMGLLIPDGSGYNGTRRWRIPLNMGGEKISPPPVDIEDEATEGVKSDAGGVKSATEGVKPTSPEPSINHQEPFGSGSPLPIDWQIASGKTIAFMTTDHFKAEVSFLAQQYFRYNEDLIPYAETFMHMTGHMITKRDAPLWRKALRGMVEQHYTVEDFRIALVEHLDKKGKDGTPLSIKSPLSVEYALRHNQVEPQGVWVSA